jgi:hypothetical protein
MSEFVPHPDDYALVIGIDHYPASSCLDGPVKDAQGILNWLQHADGGGLSQENCYCVLSPDLAFPGGPEGCVEAVRSGKCLWHDEMRCTYYDQVYPRHSERPIKDQIDDACDDLLRSVRSKKRPGLPRARRLYFYFSGHGISHDAGTTYLLLAKWSELNRYAALDHRSYLMMFIEFGFFEEVVFFLDCCQVRRVNIRGDGPRQSSRSPDPVWAGKTRAFVGVAAEYLSVAWEGTAGALHRGLSGDTSATARSYFTRALLDALWGAAAGPGGGVSASNLTLFVQREVPSLALREGRTQVPRLSSFTGHSTDNLMFGRVLPVPSIMKHGSNRLTGPTGPPTSIRLSFAEGRSGLHELIGPNADVVHSGPVESQPWELRLWPGKLYVMNSSRGIERVFVPALEGTHDVVF